MTPMTQPPDSTRYATWAAMFVAAIMISQAVAGRALRDGFFLSHFAASALPAAMIGASLLTVAIVLGSARLFRHAAPSRSLPLMFAGNAAVFVLVWALSLDLPRVAAALLYLHISSVGSVVISGFWSVVNERFDPHVAKQVIGRIAGGATLGGVLGGLAAWGGAILFDIPTMILILSGVNALCAVAARQIGGPTHVRQVEEGSGISVFEIVEETPYVRHLALMVAAVAFSGAVYDYVFKASAAAHFVTSAELVSFFALFYLGLGIATFLMQNLFARRSLLVFGLALTVGLLPWTFVGLGLLALLVPGIAVATLMRGGVSAMENSLYRSGYELLYTPLIPEKKRPIKTLIDVGMDKIGAAAGAGVVFLILGFFPMSAIQILLVIAIAAAVGAVLLTPLLHQGYVHSLTESLRSGEIDADAVEALDATTRRTVSQTVTGIERDELITHAGRAARPIENAPGRSALLERLQTDAAATGSVEARPMIAPKRRPFVPPPSRDLDVSEVDHTIAAVIDLRFGDRQRIEAALAVNHPLPEPLVAHVIPLLAREDVAEVATAALRRVAPAHTGLLLDSALSMRTPLAARRRVCEILGRLPTQRCASGLVFLLDDREFELRFRAAAGLLRGVQSNPSLRIPREQLLEAATLEAADCLRRWKYQTALTEKLTRTPALESAEGRRVVQGLAHVFTLLLAVLDREPLTLAIRALADSTGGQRGTGLEYLDNVLPTDLRAVLFPLLEEHRLALATMRSHSEILAELVEDEALALIRH
jgi:AAA family ATP:ADP antiporter